MLTLVDIVNISFNFNHIFNTISKTDIEKSIHHRFLILNTNKLTKRYGYLSFVFHKKTVKKNCEFCTTKSVLIRLA